jgi:NAD(P)-dependent dehydrogenase (short-subunit alcohol dehydrogenase family)
LVAAWLAEQPEPERFRAELLAGIPLRAFAAPEDIANAIAFLASEEARHITGATLPVDGGYTAQ